MAIGIVNDADFEKEIKRINGEDEPEARVVDINKGRGNKKETPESVRKVVGEELVLGTRRNELAKTFNVSESSVSAYGNGAKSTASYNEGTGELKEHVDKVKETITKSARANLISALQNITPEKLGTSKVKELSQVAKDMSVVIKNIEPQAQQGNNGVQFVFFAPKLKKETDYETITIDER